MSASPHFEFVTALARDLSRGEIDLPSFPDVVVRIRDLLQKEEVRIEQVSQVVNTDPMLVSRLLVFANSAHFNPAGVHIESLDTAISRLGFELVRNTAMSLAIKQIFIADQYREILPALREVWQESIAMSAMCSVVAANRGDLKHETAFLCGLLSGVGKLYILKRAGDFPNLLGNADELQAVVAEWHPQIGKSVVESWNFPDAVAAAVDPDAHMSEFTHEPPALVDVVFVAGYLLAERPRLAEVLPDVEAADADFSPPGSAWARLQIGREDLPAIYAAFNAKVAAVREALAG